MNIDDIRTSYLSDDDAKFVYEQYPEAKRKNWCPSCDGKDEKCDHELQRALFKLYANAGIGSTYMRISWDMYDGRKDIVDFCNDYLSNLKAYKENNVGMMLLGSNGIGKTTAMSLLIKSLVLKGQKCFFTTYAKLVSMLGDSFYDGEAKNEYNKRILHSTFLAIDDVGKEMIPNKLTRNAIDNVLRERIQASRPTFMTSNMSKVELLNEYGRSSFSLLMEAAKTFEIDDDNDRRSFVKESRLKLAHEGKILPIV